ncbi:unnamed protein product [Mytilus coruscus]|uniref:B box-type domain-containing protein n=1 Tax=Mytilus coruscus TaxID=42192 RepID=A0A6J8DP95_MYTCO|nr:unnamed protein product [Mytilus coruscus]
MATDWSTCGVCDNLKITKFSVVWCSECDQGLCGECKNHHAVSKASKSHENISIAEYKKLPTEVLQIAQTCKLHNEKYELFCRKHDCPCSSVQEFGEINVSSDPCDFSIQKRKDRQAQIMVALPTRNIENLTLTLQKRINTKLSDVYGCSLLPGNRMVFSSYSYDILRVLKSNGSKDFEIKKIGLTCDVVFICEDSIAVTSGSSKQINIIDLKKHKLKKSFKVYSYNNGVVYKDRHLIYCAREKGLQMISLNDETITNISNTKLPKCAYVTTFGDKLFYTNNDSVTCCDYHGNILWTFYDKSVLLCPLSISVENDGHVFVAGFGTHNVVAISPNGQRYRQLLSSEDGLRDPQALHYDTSTNEMLVANLFDEAFLYDVK